MKKILTLIAVVAFGITVTAKAQVFGVAFGRPGISVAVGAPAYYAPGYVAPAPYYAAPYTAPAAGYYYDGYPYAYGYGYGPSVSIAPYWGWGGWGWRGGYYGGWRS